MSPPKKTAKSRLPLSDSPELKKISMNLDLVDYDWIKAYLQEVKAGGKLPRSFSMTDFISAAIKKEIARIQSEQPAPSPAVRKQ